LSCIHRIDKTNKRSIETRKRKKSSIVEWLFICYNFVWPIICRYSFIIFVRRPSANNYLLYLRNYFRLFSYVINSPSANDFICYIRVINYFLFSYLIIFLDHSIASPTHSWLTKCTPEYLFFFMCFICHWTWNIATIKWENKLCPSNSSNKFCRSLLNNTEKKNLQS